MPKQLYFVAIATVFINLYKCLWQKDPTYFVLSQYLSLFCFLSLSLCLLFLPSLPFSLLTENEKERINSGVRGKVKNKGLYITKMRVWMMIVCTSYIHHQVSLRDPLSVTHSLLVVGAAYERESCLSLQTEL